jgi:hypothetical protein
MCYNFNYTMWRRNIFLVGFSLRAAFQAPTFLFWIWSYLFSRESWDLKDEFQTIIDNQDQDLYGSTIPFDLTFWQACVYHYIAMNDANFSGFFRIFGQTIVDMWAGIVGVVLFGVPIWLCLLGFASKWLTWNEIINEIFVY